MSCQQEPPTQGAVEDNHVQARAAVDALDKNTADARKARISNVEYDALIDIAASEEDIVGQLSIQFELSDATSDLTLDFTGGTLNSLRVNGAIITDDYNGYYITLPAEQLELGTNTVIVAYRTRLVMTAPACIVSSIRKMA